MSRSPLQFCTKHSTMQIPTTKEPRIKQNATVQVGRKRSEHRESRRTVTAAKGNLGTFGSGKILKEGLNHERNQNVIRCLRKRKGLLPETETARKLHDTVSDILLEMLPTKEYKEVEASLNAYNNQIEELAFTNGFKTAVRLFAASVK